MSYIVEQPITLPVEEPVKAGSNIFSSVSGFVLLGALVYLLLGPKGT